MKRLRLLLALLFAATVFAGEAPPTRQQFVFTQAGRHVIVWYFVPPGATPQTPIVIVMHGVGRNGEDYLNDWLPFAQAKGFLLVVPEFSKTEFPGAEGYNDGNIVDHIGHAVPREQWAFSMIEPIFDAVRDRTANRTERYRLFGHSAGSQFVQRFVYFVPAARLEGVVCANAGWYTLPDLSIAFPYGLKNTPVKEADLRHALTLTLTVLLGTADVDPGAPALRHTPEADAQGMFRLARGKFFMAQAEAAAKRFEIPLGWRMATMPDVGHADKSVTAFAVHELFPH